MISEIAEGGQERRRIDPVSRLAVFSLLVNLSLVGIKLILSHLSGSHALRADAVHSMVDVFGSTALILGIFISGRKSKSFPYGLLQGGDEDRREVQPPSLAADGSAVPGRRSHRIGRLLRPGGARPSEVALRLLTG